MRGQRGQGRRGPGEAVEDLSSFAINFRDIQEKT